MDDVSAENVLLTISISVISGLVAIIIWENFLKKQYEHFSGALLKFLTFGRKKSQDSLYAEAAWRSYSDTQSDIRSLFIKSLILMFICIATYKIVTLENDLDISCYLYEKMVEVRECLIARSETDNVSVDWSGENHIRGEFLQSIVGIVLLVLLGLYLSARNSYISSIGRFFWAKLDEISPYITHEERLDFRSRFSVIKTKLDYENLLDDMVAKKP